MPKPFDALSSVDRAPLDVASPQTRLVIAQWLRKKCGPPVPKFTAPLLVPTPR